VALHRLLLSDENAGKLRFVAKDETAEINRLIARFERTGRVRGRPLKRVTRSQRFCLRITESELYKVQAAARHSGESPSEWARKKILLAADEEVGDPLGGRPRNDGDQTDTEPESG